MPRLKHIEPIVEMILTEYPHTRNSDDALYLEYCKRTNSIACNMPFKDVIGRRDIFGLPSYESVSRVRRKLQSKYESLRATREVEHGREEEYEDFVEYANEV